MTKVKESRMTMLVIAWIVQMVNLHHPDNGFVKIAKRVKFKMGRLPLAFNVKVGIIPQVMKTNAFLV
jgi:hypothetical protein